MNNIALETHLTPPMSDAEKNRRDALLTLDVNRDYNYSPARMLEELKFNYGYSDKEARRVYEDWLKVQA